MADPRNVQPVNRQTGDSELMKALRNKAKGGIVNFCPFGCEDHKLDENGACAHLVGFTNDGRNYEPRVKITAKGMTPRIITSGRKKLPLERGMKLVRITSSARVYSPKPNPALVVTRYEIDEAMQEMADREREFTELAEAIRNPQLDGDWAPSVYDYEPAGLAAAATSPAS